LLAAVACLQELDGDDGGLGGDGDQLEEPVGGAELTVFAGTTDETAFRDVCVP
jgi:hypothetical protein